jgi:signal transduction histidine kinase
MTEICRRRVDEHFLDGLLGLESSKIGFYAEVKQKIQELEQTNLRLRTKRSELQAVFDSIQEAVMIYDSTLVVESRNHVCPRLFPQDSQLDTPCAALFHPDIEGPAPECPVEAAVQGATREVFFSRPGKEHERYFEATATPIQGADGRTSRALIFIREVTDRKRQEMKLHQTAKLSSIGMLAAGMAHEINNPLSSVAGYAEALLRRFRESPELAEHPELAAFPDYLEVIMRESYRCKSIIESLLSFSRKPQAARGPVDLAPLVGEVLELLHHRARTDNIELHTDLAPEVPPVMGDPNGLRQVVMNLTMNALQAAKARGQVRIATRIHDGEALLCVSDTGPGIPADKLDMIWDPFFTTKGVGEGAGLGLSVTHDIVQKHGGRIDVTSSEGRGTRFTVHLPTAGGSDE